MAVTTDYSFNLPTVGGNLNTWGALLNDNFTALDSLLSGDTTLTGLDVTGSVIEDTTVGAVTPSTGSFTVLTATSLSVAGAIISAAGTVSISVQDTDGASGADIAQFRVDTPYAYLQGTGNGKLRFAGHGNTDLTEFEARVAGAWQAMLYDNYASDVTFGGDVAATTFTGSGAALTGVNKMVAASEAEALAGTSNTVAMTPLRTEQAITASYLGHFIVQETQASGTDGGTFTSGAWRTRDLNTVQHNSISGASLASKRVTLPAGTYRVRGGAFAFRVNSNAARLYSITASATLLIGSSNYAYSSDNGYVESAVVGIFTLGATTVIELQHDCETTFSDRGFGDSGDTGERELYAHLEIERLA
jgi:hypothetical protein